MSKGDKDTRTPNYTRRRNNYEGINWSKCLGGGSHEWEPMGDGTEWCYVCEQTREVKL